MINFSRILFLFILHTIWAEVRTNQLQKNGPTPTPFHDWDYLVYSQSWPLTFCTYWKEINPEHSCSFPADKMQWMVHGIWPTKIGAHGPYFCPSSVHFDPGQLSPFLDELKNHWASVRNDTKPYSFWKHEWDKHGTCSVTVPELDSIPNFFLKGLEWNQNYNISQMLIQSDIIPGTTGYTVEQISGAVKAVTKYDPFIECIVDQLTKESILSEIHICFDKSLDLVNCLPSSADNIKNGSIVTNCSEKKPVKYIDTVALNSISYQMDYVDNVIHNYNENRFFLEMYKLLRFLIWFTI